jgi:hypothetical protein
MVAAMTCSCTSALFSAPGLNGLGEGQKVSFEAKTDEAQNICHSMRIRYQSSELPTHWSIATGIFAPSLSMYLYVYIEETTARESWQACDACGARTAVAEHE